MKKHLLEILVSINIIIGVILLGLIIYFHFFDQEEVPEINEDIKQAEIIETEKPENKQIAVEIKGAVVNPGVYHLEEKMIIDDLVNAAGGLNANAFTNNINFSKELKNEMVIYIYTNYEYHQLEKKEVEITTCQCPEVDITPCLDSGTSIIVSQTNSKDEEIITEENNSQLININTASISELTSLNGIGEAKAKNIVEYRQNNGPFNSIEDIKKVTGISETIYDKIKDYITI